MKKLPPNDYPIYKFEIPSQNTTKRFRPFLVKEQKALLIAQGSEKPDVMVDTLKQVIADCCIDEIDADDLAIFDIEYLLLKLRSVSVSDKAEVIVSCDGDHGDAPDSTKQNIIEIDMNLLEVIGIKQDRTVKLSTNKAVVMRYPSINILKLIDKDGELTSDDYTRLVMYCLQEIIIGDEVFTMDDLDDEDIHNWLETLDNESFEKIVEFVKEFPYTRVRAEWTCKYCGKHNERYLIGLESFF